MSWTDYGFCRTKPEDYGSPSQRPAPDTLSQVADRGGPVSRPLAMAAPRVR